MYTLSSHIVQGLKLVWVLHCLHTKPKSRPVIKTNCRWPPTQYTISSLPLNRLGGRLLLVNYFRVWLIFNTETGVTSVLSLTHPFCAHRDVLVPSMWLLFWHQWNSLPLLPPRLRPANPAETGKTAVDWDRDRQRHWSHIVVGSWKNSCRGRFGCWCILRIVTGALEIGWAMVMLGAELHCIFIYGVENRKLARLDI